MEELLNELKEKFSSVIIEVQEKDYLTLICKRTGFLDLIKHLKEEKGFKYLIDLCGVDYLNYPKKNFEERFEVVYHLYNLDSKVLLRLKVRIPEEDCWHHSVTPLFRTANFFERECYDMFGISFKGHPDLRRILMPDDWEGHPLRKDYPVYLEEEQEWDTYKKFIQKYKG
ncbi:MAG: NADH:ubiquinone oxidoreductase 27 kD subunit [Thermodesulfobacterium sp.]|uniref:NADH-quinone oxidoreductase subunit C n=1 Tax=Candidatus Thermodesulfobacterium syntrophicum TaxID=3060442 RepID=A0AAE3TEN9_9BACT|nr:NADH:ubiquinone oxidoreductase 27 kD subunit [Candidatus Thermodesulfobacterium syntrophicum]